MDPLIYEILKLVIMILSAIVVYRIIPFLKAKTSIEQREEAEYWIRVAIRVAEQIYKDKGQGTLKKEYVLEWLNKNGIQITKEQADVLIDLIVKEFNKWGWD